MFRPIFYLLVAFVAAPLLAASPEATGLYYELESEQLLAPAWEIRANGGYEFSNAYLHLLHGDLSAWRVFNRDFAIGAEWRFFADSPRASTTALSSQLAPYGFHVDPLVPEHSGSIVARYVVLQGMLNWLSRSVWITEIAVLGEVGVMKYSGFPLAPLIGTGMELRLGIDKHFSMLAAWEWAAAQPRDHAWESHVSVRIGPAIRW